MITPRDRSLITPEESKQARECLNMSQRSVAEQAGVPRTYLNQFERRRWIADDAFLLKLSDFYFGQGGGGGGFGPVDSEESPIEEPQIIIGADKDISCSEVAKSSPKSEPDLKTTESNAKSGWNAVGRAAIAIALVGGILAATGNLPVALGLLKSLRSARQPQPPFGL